MCMLLCAQEVINEMPLGLRLHCAIGQGMRKENAATASDIFRRTVSY